MKKTIFLLINLAFMAAIFSCHKTANTPAETSTSMSLPNNFPPVVYNFKDNPFSEEKILLGKKLFFDPILSKTNTISCANCHIPENAFSHFGHSVSHGIEDRLGIRNAPALFNLAWNASFSWDGGVLDLDFFPIAPITNPVEMGETMEGVLSKLKHSELYAALFQKSFPNEAITAANFLKSLSQFMLSVISAQSKYDSVQQQKAEFSASEARGYVLFKTNCNRCHTEPLFTNHQFSNNGLPPSEINDIGRQKITNQARDKYLFKIPSLRNLSFSAPYMHDGRFRTLSAVLDHYSEEMKPTENLAAFFQKNNQIGVPLSLIEKADLLAFLKTLDDYQLIKNPRLSNPQ